MKTKDYILSILKNHQKEKINPHEIIHKHWDDSYVFIVKGSAVAFRHENTLTTYYPVLFKSGNILGPLNLLIDNYSSRRWELLALEETEIIFFTPDMMKKNSDLKIIFYEQSLKMIAFSQRGYYIWGRGGAKAYLAFLLFNYSENSIISKDKLDILSKMLSVNRSIYLRIIKSFISMKILKKRKGGIFIENSIELKNIYLEYL